MIMKNYEILKKVSELLDAKESVLFCLNNPKGSVSFHGLEYWAGTVERLRKELNGVL